MKVFTIITNRALLLIIIRIVGLKMDHINNNGKRIVSVEEGCEENVPVDIKMVNVSQAGGTKRQRAPNFSTEEKSLLLTLVYDLRHKIENKKTDGITIKEKEKAWYIVMTSFNAQNPSKTYRTMESLKKFYENQKKAVRKEVAEKKTSASKTGGGPGDYTEPNDLTDLTLAVMNPKTVKGVENKFDSVGVRDDEESETEYENILLLSADEPTEEVCDQLDWGDYTPAHLKTPINEKLKNTKTIPILPAAAGASIPTSTATGKQNNTPSSWATRRRPITEQLHSSKLSEQYGELATIKHEIARLQLDILKQKAITDEEREKILFDLRVQSLQLDINIKKLDIEIKKAQLRKM